MARPAARSRRTSPSPDGRVGRGDTEQRNDDSQDHPQRAEANRRRYEELRAAGQGATSEGLPPLTVLGSVPIAPAAIIQPARWCPVGWYMATRLRRGEMLRLIDATGAATPALIAWREEDTSERINCADTVKVQWSAAVRRGRVILSDMGRVMLSIDRGHQRRARRSDGRLGAGPRSLGCGASLEAHAENFLAATAKLGLQRRDIPPCISFFAPVIARRAPVAFWQGERKRPGDFVDLRAEMDLLVGHLQLPAPAASGALVVRVASRLMRSGTAAAAYASARSLPQRGARSPTRVRVH